MGLPVTGGNVSFYNQTGSVAILPTPVIGVLGVIQDVRTRTKMGLPKAGLDIYQLGTTDDNFSGSEWAHLHGQIGDTAPKADVGHETRLVNLLLAGQPLFAAAHDLSDGGFAAGITEMVLKNNIGATIEFAGNIAAELFAQTPGRVIVAVEPQDSEALTALAAQHGISITRLGQSGGDILTINGAHLPLAELGTAHTETFHKLFG
jgi:phosphoribosylformylglycinamidine synthase